MPLNGQAHSIIVTPLMIRGWGGGGNHHEVDAEKLKTQLQCDDTHPGAFEDKSEIYTSDLLCLHSFSSIAQLMSKIFLHGSGSCLLFLGDFDQ